MRIMVRDVIILVCVLVLWLGAIFMCLKNKNDQLYEAVLAFPGHLVITVVYYAVCNVAYSILFISDCENEYGELMKDIDEGRKFFEKKGIKYN